MRKTLYTLALSAALPVAGVLVGPTSAAALEMDCWQVHGLSHASFWCHVIHDDGSDEWMLSR
ncbi:hypothetical protein [Skermania piniformis]|uniref:Uncharacterized protein n=1 Tax=Skermania pinensis TaxID=39122 RepID=A0ABX8SAC1_9ACTN|nr:hypothetical protein [Skermania piniformis]QXQ13939.1 hypothetical protein KV203_00180 [Skermania piniformis]